MTAPCSCQAGTLHHVLALQEEACKCWEVKGATTCLLHLTDEKGHGKDKEMLKVVPVAALSSMALCWRH